MDKMGIVLCNMYPIMREIVRDLVNRQADMEVVGEAESLARLSTVIDACHAEAVIATLSSADMPGTVSTLQTAHPGLLVLSFGDDQHGPVVCPCEGSPQPVEATGAAVLSAIRRGRKMRAGAKAPRWGSNVKANA